MALVRKIPQIAERPQINAELTYRLHLLRTLDHVIKKSEMTHGVENSAYGKAMKWGHECLVSLAQSALDELGPLSAAAQQSELEDFVKSLHEA